MAFPRKPTRRAVTTIGSNDLVVGEDRMLGPSCQRYNCQTGRCGSIAFGSSPRRGKTLISTSSYFHIRRLQLFLGLRWWHKVTHSEIRSRAGIPTIESMLLHRQLRWLGHVIRMSHSRLPHCVLYGQLRLGHRSVGGQKKCFKYHIKSTLRTETFLLAGWRLSHPTELPGDLHVPLECHTLTMNTIEMQLSDAVADISMLQCSAQFRFCSSMPTLWQTMLLTYWPPQSQ